MNDEMTALLARATALLEAASALAADIKALVERTGPQIDLIEQPEHWPGYL